ncbi:MAG: hypothetical protein K1X79_02630 [Oligoflexia bacterium]|nr:hypothetical protein [Oligoflexia bacterium]
MTLEDLTTTHLWVCSYPYVDSTLFVVPPAVLGDSSARTAVAIYDADGNTANEVDLEFPSNQIGIIELESIMGGCKLEAGIKHGHAVVQSPVGYSHFCRIHTREGAALIGAPASLTADHSSFFPITFDEGRQYFLAFVNETRSTANVKCRLFCGKRSPETLLTIPPLGSRVIHVETEFPDYAGGDTGKQLQGYVRISTKSEGRIGVQLIERHATKSEGGVFSAVG